MSTDTSATSLTAVPAIPNPPLIVVNDRELPDISEDCIRALADRNDPPKLFRRGGQVVWLIRDKDHGPLIREVSEPAFRGILARDGMFCRLKPDRDGNMQQVSCSPPMDVVRDLLALPPEKLSLPPLKGVVRAPVFRADGSLILTPGYDHASQLYYEPSEDLVGLKVPDNPGQSGARLSAELLMDAIADFPYIDPASRANAIALLLAPAIRPLVRNAPLMTLSATQPGSGKTLQAELVSIIHTSEDAVLVTAPRPNSDEWGKLLVAQLSVGKPLTIFDNLSYRLESDALASVVTSGFYEGRTLGRTEVCRYPQQTTFIVTGNNLALGDDMSRRCVWIQLNPRTANAYRRTDFRHPNLKEWVFLNRRRLLTAVLIAIRAWFAAGQPKSSSPVIGSFEDWCRIMGGILAFAGIEGFLGNFDDLARESSSATGDWEPFLYGILHQRPSSERPMEETESRVLTSKEIFELIVNTPLREVLPDGLAEAVKRQSATALGKQLAGIAERRFGDEGIYLAKLGQNRMKVSQWQIRIANPTNR